MEINQKDYRKVAICGTLYTDAGIFYMTTPTPIPADWENPEQILRFTVVDKLQGLMDNEIDNYYSAPFDLLVPVSGNWHIEYECLEKEIYVKRHEFEKGVIMAENTEWIEELVPMSAEDWKKVIETFTPPANFHPDDFAFAGIQNEEPPPPLSLFESGEWWHPANELPSNHRDVTIQTRSGLVSQGYFDHKDSMGDGNVWRIYLKNSTFTIAESKNDPVFIWKEGKFSASDSPTKEEYLKEDK